MKYLIEIDGGKELGKSAMSILKNIAKKDNGIVIRKTESYYLDDDARMVKRMLRARKGGFTNTEEFLVKLKSKL